MDKSAFKDFLEEQINAAAKQIQDKKKLTSTISPTANSATS